MYISSDPIFGEDDLWTNFAWVGVKTHT